MTELPPSSILKKRLRGFYPVIIDVETGGFNPITDALLEIAAVTITVDEAGYFKPADSMVRHIIPFNGAILMPEALKFNGIDPFHPERPGISESQALQDIFQLVRHHQKLHDCQRAILVGHNPGFDIAFLNAAVARCEIKRNPFHPFSTLDTATLSALTLGQTVLAKAAEAAHIEFDPGSAHSALYDAAKTAELFCAIFNQWLDLGGWDNIKQAPAWPAHLPKEETEN